MNKRSFAMATTALPENYCVCVGEDGAPREIGRSGTAVTYKAMGYQSGQAVALQLIPLANVSEAGRAQFELKARALHKLKHPNIARVFDVRVEDEHLVFATEFLQGETAERWVVTHGPMPPDAVLRVGLQVVSALAEAAFHSLSHRAIQPSNLMIVTGAAPDGDWPFVKLLNFGLAGLKLYSEGAEELVPSIGAAFASPEQLEKGKVDFCSEIFSLGATMCFLLTGAVPLTGREGKDGVAERILPSGAPIPRVVRRLLRHMLRLNPDERPHDPLFLTDELQKCLRRVRRGRALSRQANAPLEIEPSIVPANRSGWAGPLLTAVTVLLLLAGLAVVFLPGHLRWWTRQDKPLESLGVPIGIDESAPANGNVAAVSPSPIPESSSTPDAVLTPPSVARSSTETPVTVAGNSPIPDTPRSETNVNASPPSDQNAVVQNAPEPGQEITTPVPLESPVPAPAETSANEAAPEPPPPREAPPAATATPPPGNAAPVIAQHESPAAAEPDAAERSEATPPTPAPAAKPMPPKSPGSASNSASRAWRTRPVPVVRVGTTPVRIVGKTGEGNLILRLPSGKTVVTPPLPETNDAPVISHRRVRKIRIPPRALPVDAGPPVVVLPPEN